MQIFDKNKVFYLDLIIVAHSCELGWYQYENDKCVMIYDLSSTYDESVQYCKSAFKAKLLSISSLNEKKFWSFYLFRYLKTEENVWLQPFDTNSIQKFNISKESNLINGIKSECFAMKSLKEDENAMESRVGNIVTQNCESLGATICEIPVRTKPRPQPPVDDMNQNLDFIPNRRIKLTNGNESKIFTGLYYKITSKSNNQVFMDQSRGSVSHY